jgi:hypothetical protein
LQQISGCAVLQLFFIVICMYVCLIFCSTHLATLHFPAMPLLRLTFETEDLASHIATELPLAILLL